MTDGYEYPTEEYLTSLENWQWSEGWGELMERVKAGWWQPEWGFHRPEGERNFNLSTGGWSGNEQIISALQRNFVFWSVCWLTSRRGGHYQFELPAKKGTPEAEGAYALED